MSTPKPILVTGATGKQGKAVLNNLLLLNDQSADSPPFTVLALTRDTTSKAALSLTATHPNVILIQGNLSKPSAIFTSIDEKIKGKLWGVYSVQIGIGQPQKDEEAQGKGLIDAAIKSGVRHFVYSSAARLPRSNITVNQFESKICIEAYLKEKCDTSKAPEQMTYTILQPTGFFENLRPGIEGKAFAGIMRHFLPKGFKLAFIAADDIGYFAAQAFLHPEAAAYRNTEIVLAGDKLSFEDMKKVYEEKRGESLPLPIGGKLLPLLVTQVFVKELGVLFKYFSQEEYEVDIAALRKMHPGLKNFSAWLDSGK